jgi:hypothetical protein
MVRVTLQPLAAGIDTESIPLTGPSAAVGALWTRVLEWRCRDHLLSLQVLAAEAIDLPGNEVSEPVAGALARLQQALHGHGGLLLLRNPHEAFGPARIALTSGVRLFAIASAADEACWDAALSLVLPVYGVRDVLSCEVASGHPAAVISALAYGAFVCEQGLQLARLDEDRTGVRIVGQSAVEATVIVRGGFEAARLKGDDLRWDDRGNEGYVRLLVQSAGGRCWTQPRFVAPRSPIPGGAHGHP